MRKFIKRSVLILVGISLFLLFISLGTWQVKRRAWKLDLIEKIETRTHQKPLAFGNNPIDKKLYLKNKEYLPVSIIGKFLNEFTIFSQALTELGAGFWVLTPIETKNKEIVFINRGFIPSEMRKNFSFDKTTEDILIINGLLRNSEPKGGFLRKNNPNKNIWYSRDIKAITEVKNLEKIGKVAPFFIDYGLPTDTWNNNIWPRPSMTVIKFYNNHMAYILTWYSLAILTLVAIWLVVKYELNQKNQNSSSENSSSKD